MLATRDARMIALRNNIQRYCRLLATQLTDLERAFIHRRLAEDRLAIEALGGGDEISNGMPLSDETPASKMQLFTPLCSMCGTLTWLETIEPTGQAGREERTFECPACGNRDVVLIDFR